MSARLKHVTMEARLRDEDNSALTRLLVDLGRMPSATQGFLAPVTLMAKLVAIAADASQVIRQSLGLILRAIFTVHRSTFGMDRFTWSSGTEHTAVFEYASAFSKIHLPGSTHGSTSKLLWCCLAIDDSITLSDAVTPCPGYTPT